MTMPDWNDLKFLEVAMEQHPDRFIPFLMINAKNDPILGEGAYPYGLAKTNKHFFLEVPDSGGHVGFATMGKTGVLWTEKRALQFVMEYS